MKKLITILIVTATLILGAVAIFTAIRIYQSQTKPVVPSQPESKPEAAFPGTGDVSTVGATGQVIFKCGTITGGTIPVGCTGGAGGPGERPGSCKIIGDPNTTTNQFDVIITPISENPSCPRTVTAANAVVRCSTDQQKNPVSNYKTTYEIKAERATSEVKITLMKNSNWCEDPCGQLNPNDSSWNGICIKNGKREPVEVILNASNGYKTTVDIERSSDTGLACGSYQTDIWFTSISDCLNFVPPNDWGTLTWSLCYTGNECPNKPPVCNPLTFSLASSTATPTPTPIVTPTPTTTPTSTPNSCNGSCGSNANCGSDFYCYQGFCRNASCPTETDCTCGGKTCNQSCSLNADCTNGLVCSGGMCRNSSCTGESDCICTTSTPIAGPTSEPTLPNAGIGTPTLVGMGTGLLLLLISLALAL